MIFNVFGLENYYDYLFIGTGVTPTADTVLYSLTESGLPELIIPNSNMWLSFQSDGSVKDVGFEVVVSLIGEYILFELFSLKW